MCAHRRIGHQQLERHGHRRQRGGIGLDELHPDQYVAEGSSPGFTDNLSGIVNASLTDTGGSHTFTVSGWTGTGSLTDTSVTGDIVADAASGSFTLTNTSLAAPNTTLGMTGFTTANLTDTGTGHIFTISGWTGGGSLTAHSDTLVDSVSANVTLTNSSLAVTGLPALTLNGITTASLTDTGSGHTFNVGGWTGSGSLTDTRPTRTPWLPARAPASP